MKTAWHAHVSRFWDFAGSVNVRTKIMGIVLGGTILLSTVLTLQVIRSLSRVLEDELRARGASIGRDLAARSTDLILVNNLYALRQLLLETQANNPDVRYAFVLDTEGQVLVHTFGEGFPAGLIELNQAAPDDYQHTVSLETPEGMVWDIAVPVFGGKAGTARVGISNQGVRRVLLELTTQVALTTAVVLVMSLLAAAFLTFILTRPILDLVDATRAVGRGDFTRRVRRWANDEIGELAEAFNQMTVELERADEVRTERELLRRQVIAAQEEERRRISRELHDSTSQSLTSLMVGLRTLDGICDNLQVHLQAKELRDVTEQVLDDVHTLAVQLRPSVLDDLGLAAALERLAQDWSRRHQIRADVLVHIGEERLLEGLETALYRIVQEALTNVARHAQAKSVSVLVERRVQDVVAVIEDDGLGFDPGLIHGEGHLGLAGIRERAELLGGSLTIESNPGNGTSLFVQLPLAQYTAPGTSLLFYNGA
jgi:signal transduction histidine kinase